MRLVSTLRLATLESDPSFFSDYEMYFNTNENSVKISYSGSWFALSDTGGQEFSLTRDINEITGESASYSYLILNSEQNSILLAQSSSAVNFIIPSNDTEPIDIGASIKVVRSGEGVVYFTPEDGVTINSANSNFLTAQWTAADLIKIGTNNWFLDTEYPDIY